MPAMGASTQSQTSRWSQGWPFFRLNTMSALTAPTPIKARTRTTPNRKVRPRRPFHGRITRISAATTWNQASPSASTTPSVGACFAPPGVASRVSVVGRRGVSIRRSPPLSSDSRACSRMSEA